MINLCVIYFVYVNGLDRLPSSATNETIMELKRVLIFLLLAAFLITGYARPSNEVSRSNGGISTISVEFLRVKFEIKEEFFFSAAPTYELFSLLVMFVKQNSAKKLTNYHNYHQ